MKDTKVRKYRFLMNKAAFLDPRFKNFPHLSIMVSSATRESISLTLQEEMIPVFEELSRDSIAEDEIEIIDDHQP